MRRRTVAVGAIITCGLFAAGWWAVTRGRSADAPDRAQVTCPTELDLGRAEIHTTAVAVLRVANTGGRPATLTAVTGDCGCMGITLLPARTPVTPASAVPVPAGGQAELAFALTVSGAHGVPAGHRVRFSTDDPDRPEVEVHVRFTPVARYFADPATVSFGEVLPGTTPEATVDLYTTDPAAHVVAGDARSSDPARVSVVVVPEDAASPPASAPGPVPARRFARLRVGVPGLPAGEAVAAQVQSYVAGRAAPAVQIPVTARAAAAFTLAPATVYLPRASSAGPVYEATAVCKAAADGPFDIVVPVVGGGVAVRVDPVPGCPLMQRITVSCQPGQLIGDRVRVPVVARRGGTDYPLELIVSVDRPPVTAGGAASSAGK